VQLRAGVPPVLDSFRAPVAPDPAPVEPYLRTSAIVFAYDEEATLRRCIPALLASSVEEILVMYGGEDGSRSYLESIRDPRIHLAFEPARAGKWRAFNLAIERVRGEVVFLVSGDISFSPTVFDHLRSRFAPDVGVVFPRVVPTNVRGWVSRMGAALWDVHDLQIVACAREGMPVHGGELQAVRRSLLEPIAGVINEDAYLCLRAAEQGYRVLYDRESVVRNTVPETLADLLAQRTRVNYGHRQLAQAGLDPSTLDRLIWDRPRVCLRVLARAMVNRPANAVRLPLLAGLELIALVRGTRDFRHGVEYGIWSLIRSGKTGPFPGHVVEPASAVLEK
jgi:cellulose synthase/poly-beta-1,6-N-acetylglucosamine synthase-like glycosyltransferase